ncbi:MAG: IclR family transcriptional regulator [Desulfobacteraceae bacterium]|nr:IclR family transcriptional regulator [Desulfobacteraceae bacterium]
MANKYQAPIVTKAFRILSAVADTADGMGISEISRNLDISKSTVHGITSALEGQGALIKDPLSKRFSIGYALIELGKKAYSQVNLKEIARPFIEKLMKACQESVFLGIRNKKNVIILDVVESKKDYKITSPVGTIIPLLAGAVGKVFMSEMSKKDVAEVINSDGLKKFTEKTIINPKDYDDELSLVKKQGFAIDDEEYLPGVRAVAAPVKSNGLYLTSVWVVGFKSSMDDVMLKKITEQVISTAEKISKETVKYFAD